MNDIRLKGLVNARDLGGIVTKYGIMKKGKLLRSPALDKLTKNDIEILKNHYQLKTIIDLRTDKEVEERKDVIFPNTKYLHMPIFNERFPGITHEKQEEFDDAYDNFDLDLSRLYHGIMSTPYLEKVAEIVKTIMHLQDEEYAVLFHCTAGKDRTGIISALLLLILGAEKQTIIDDYLYSNKVGKGRTFRTYWLVRLFERNKRKAENIRNVFLAKLEYINQVFEVIEKDWNGIDCFLENGLKINREEINQFRQKMLE